MVKPMAKFVADNSITIKSKRIAENPIMGKYKDMDHWSCSLAIPQEGSNRKRQMTVKFSQGYGYNGAEPTVETVLSCLALDIATVENIPTFRDWCFELGYDADSRKAETIWKACNKGANRLKVFLGEDLYKELLWDVV